MPDPSPDTPNVCPTCGSARRRKVWADDRSYEFVCGDCGKRWPTPAAPGSSSPDVAALAERLRDDGLQARHHDEVLTADDACRWGGVGALLWAEDMFKAAEALEAQAARITELEAALDLIRDAVLEPNATTGDVASYRTEPGSPAETGRRSKERAPMQVPHPARGVIVNRGLTIAAVADDIGYSRQSLYKCLSGRVQPWPELRRRVAEYLDMPEAELFLEVAA